MIDIIGKTDRLILGEILGQNAISSITLSQIMDIVREHVVKSTNELIEDLILKGKASAIIKDFREQNPSVYLELKNQIEQNSNEDKQ